MSYRPLIKFLGPRHILADTAKSTAHHHPLASLQIPPFQPPVPASKSSSTAPTASASSSSSSSPNTKQLNYIDFFELPARYRPAPLEVDEIETIEVISSIYALFKTILVD
jgi:hypothetical protein